VDEPEKFADAIWSRVSDGSSSGVLWIHGYTIDSTTWTALWSHLPAWTHNGIDLPGHGASPPPRPGTTLAEIGRSLAEAAVAGGIRHVVGMSFGSLVALEVALSRPNDFATLTLAAPTFAGGPMARDVGVRYMELARLYAERGAGPWMTELWMRSPPATFAHADASLRAELATVIDRHTWSELEQPGLGIVGLTRGRQDPRRLAISSARLLVVVGEHELPAFRETAAILREVRPDARVAELSGAGHLCLLHAPVDAARLLGEHWTG
jgi:2-succinyl-6-hydroxy-2,4-cyclohexadiene-1-carboxylate synthase